MVSGWTLDVVPLASVDTARVQGREDLFYVVTAASFVESGADLYAANLVAYFDGDQEVGDWLRRHWQIEELRHGRVLRDYVRHVWPEFDWERAYAAFLADYSRQCTVAKLERSRGLELAARCVVETGTATFYRALSLQAAEPVLAGIATRISGQEVEHYKHFYSDFRRYCAREAPGRFAIAAALARRVREARNGDADLALWHAFAVRRRERQHDREDFQKLVMKLGRQLRRDYPVRMAARMLLKPLALPAWLRRFLQGPVATAITLVLR